MPAPPNLYALLGVSPNASEAEIRQAYRRNAVYRHRRGVLRIQDTLEHMERAYEILTDPERRQRYDRERELYETPARRAAELENESLRREGQLRREYSKRMAADAERIGKERLAQHEALLEELNREPAEHAPGYARWLWLLLLLFAICLAAWLFPVR